MALELEGRIARKFNVQTGTSARGAWSKQEFILEYQEGNFPTQVCLNVWGDEKVRELEHGESNRHQLRPRHQLLRRVTTTFSQPDRIPHLQAHRCLLLTT